MRSSSLSWPSRPSGSSQSNSAEVFARTGWSGRFSAACGMADSLGARAFRGIIDRSNHRQERLVRLRRTRLQGGTMSLAVTVRSVRPSDFDQWLPLWEGYNAFYERSGPTALPAESTQTTWGRFFDSHEP